jgi:biotin carboxyl carrier protein
VRYYLVNQKQEDKIIQINKRDFGQDLIYYEGTVQNQKVGRWFKLLAGKIFVSSDQKKWKKLVRLTEGKNLVNQIELLKVYAGYKPSGLTQASAGSLVTQMPGKVIKINIKPQDKVKIGETLFIIEAMKMENEIKSSVNGVVKSVNIQVGQAIESGYLLGEIEVDK